MLQRKKAKVELLRVYGRVCDCCMTPFALKAKKLERRFQLTYDPLTGLSQGMEPIFTTNYDSSIDMWCHKRFQRCVDGTSSTENFDFRIFNRDEIVKEMQNWRRQANQSRLGTVMLVRLHGSIMTYQLNPSLSVKLNRPKEGFVFKDLYDKVLDKRPTLIFPGQEDQLQRGNWDPLYQLFKENLVGNCLFIGYSFRHEVINKPIRNYLESGKLRILYVLAPDSNKNLFGRKDGIPTDKIVEMPAKFGEEALDLLIREWFPLST